MANTELLSKILSEADFYEVSKFDGNIQQLIEHTTAYSLATEFASTYTGSYPFMLDMQRMVWENKSLSSRQIAAILNCALKEAKSMNLDNPENSSFPVVVVNKGILTDPEGNKEEGTVTSTFQLNGVSKHEYIPLVNQPGVVVHKVTNSKTGDTYVYEGPSGTGIPDLDAIHAKMDAIKAQLDEVDKINLLDTLSSTIESLDEQEAKILAEVEEKVRMLRAEKLAKRAELRSVEQNVKELKYELAKLATEAEKNVNLIEAQKQLDEITERLNNLREGAVWKDSIRSYQWDDVCYIVAAFLQDRNGVLNANDMGLGKTFESVAVLWLLQELFPTKYGYNPKVLWLTKKSLIKSSIREFRKWWPDITPLPVSGNPNQRKFIVEMALSTNAPVVVNYDALNTTPILRTTPWDIIVMDEVHKLKGGANYKPTQVWENAVDVCENAKFLLPMSGSPIQNHPKDMWAYLYMLDPIRFPDHKTFMDQYCYGYDEGMSVNWEQLIQILSNRVIRKTKADVLTELPDKEREFRYVEMLPKQREIYNSLKENFFFWLDEQEDNALTATSILAQLTRLRQVAIMPGSISIPVMGKDGNTTVRSVDCDESAKIEEAMDIIDQLVNTGEQVVIFSSQFNAPLFEIQKRVREQFNVTCETLTGENSDQLDRIEQQFTTGETRVLAINMKTGGEGLNLQAASHAIFLDLWWNPESNKQAEDRLHRMGQKNAVMIHVIQCEDSVDAFIAEILDGKTNMIGGIMDDHNTFRKEKGWKAYLTELI